MGFFDLFKRKDKMTKKAKIIALTMLPIILYFKKDLLVISFPFLFFKL